MKKFRKLLLSALAVVLIAALSVVGTIAYLTDEETAVNVMVLGEINIEQHEQDRNGNKFVQAQTLMPLVGSLQDVDAKGYPTASNYIDKLVTVENTGKNAAYVRTFIAIPKYNVSDVVLFNGFSANDTTSPATLVPGTDTVVVNNWSWGADATADVAPAAPAFSTTINGVAYDVYVVTNTEAVQPGETTAPNLAGIYLNPMVDFDHETQQYVMNGTTIDGFDPTVKVLVGTQAVQYDTGWADAWEALDTSFGTPDVGHPWAEGEVEMPTLVYTAEELQAALDNAQAGKKNNIVLADDIVGDITVTQKPNTTIVIDGFGKTLSGVLTVDGKSATYTTAGLTINDVVFAADTISADACIRLGNGTNATRYTCNVTVNGCTFDVPGAVGIKSYTGGDKNLVVTGCTITSNGHSLIQAKGIDGILVEGCFVYSKNGLNFNNSTNVTVSGCEVDVLGYAVRFGESSGGKGDAEVYTIKDSTLISANDEGDATIIIRGTADYSTLTIVNTTIEGTPDIANTATDAVVVR